MSNQQTDIIIWLQSADNEYIAARTLLRQGLILQGVILSASVIEKYLKAVHLINNVSFDTQGEKAHNVLNLYKNLPSVYSEKPLNESYLRFLNNAYKLRYPDKTPEGFNVALHQGKMLVGLDETVHKIRKRVQIKTSDGGDFKTMFDHLIEHKDDHLLNGNHAFGAASRESAFEQPLLWYEMRILKNGAWLEAHNVSLAKDDGNYDLKGLQKGSSDRQFILQAPVMTAEKQGDPTASNQDEETPQNTP